MHFRCYARIVIAALSVAAASTASAQALDDIEVAGAGGEATVTIRFAAQVRYQRHVVGPEGDLIQVYFQVTGEDSAARGVFEDTRLTPASAELPGFTVRYVVPAVRAPGRRMDVSFEQPVEVLGVGPGNDNRSLALRLRAQQRAAPGVAAPTAAAAASLPQPATSEPGGMVTQARAVMEEQGYEAAVGLLNRVLNLPPNAATQEAQELIGYAREGLGDIERARAEYELYLKLYPEGAGAERVRTRIENLRKPRAAFAAGTAQRETTVWGSISPYYYGGNSQIRTDNIIITPATNATVIDTQTLAQTDQSSLVTNLDFNARTRDGDWDSRFAFRDIGIYSFLADQPSENRLTALYGDIRYEPAQLSMRFGRQSSTSGAVLGRFDGAAFSWGFTPTWRIGALAGRPAYDTLGEKPTFAGVTLDGSTGIEGLGLGVFAIMQRTEGLTDREAVGAELRFSRPSLSAFGLLDYDVGFGQLNVGSLQGTWQPNERTTVNFLYDYRRSPTLQLTNALLGDPQASLQGLLSTLTRDELDRRALGLTPLSRVLLLGATRRISERWQLGAEVRQSSLTGTDAVGALPAMPGTGNVYTYTFQAIGTGVLTSTGVLTLTSSFLTGDAYDAALLAANARFRLGERWTIEPALRLYRQENTTGTSLTRIAPTLRTTYQLRERLAFEGEVSVERNRSNSELLDETDLILFYYFGLRWEF